MNKQLPTLARTLALLGACALVSACGGGGGAGTAAPTPTPAPAPAPVAGPTCSVNGKAWPVCATDKGGWAFEAGQYCVARSFCPATRAALADAPVRTAPVDPQATPRTRAVYDYLRSVWGRQVIAGQMDLTWNDAVDMAERVHADTGKYPALMGFDFMNVGMSGVDGLRQTEEAIAWARRGGLVTFTWHWRDPALLGTARANDAQFYARAADPASTTGFTIPLAGGALDTASPAYRQLDAGIDLVAAELRKLQDAGVTVLWRPMHEAAGSDGNGWFWWGRARSDGAPQAYAHILLWRHMYQRLVDRHGLHNLIWVWNGQDAAWYPGDDVVDVAGYDIYDQKDNRTYGAQLGVYKQLRTMSGAPKLLALTENSYIPDPDRIAAEGAWWTWFMTWNDGAAGAGVSDPNNFWSGEYYNTDAHKARVYRHPLVITLDELPASIR